MGNNKKNLIHRPRDRNIEIRGHSVLINPLINKVYTNNDRYIKLFKICANMQRKKLFTYLQIYKKKHENLKCTFTIYLIIKTGNELVIISLSPGSLKLKSNISDNNVLHFLNGNTRVRHSEAMAAILVSETGASLLPLALGAP